MRAASNCRKKGLLTSRCCFHQNGALRIPKAGLLGQSERTAAVEEGTRPWPQSRRSSARPWLSLRAHLGALTSWTRTCLDLESQGRAPAPLPALQAMLSSSCPKSLLESLGAWLGTSLCPEPSASSLRVGHCPCPCLCRCADCQGFWRGLQGPRTGLSGLRHHGVSLSPLSPGHNLRSYKRGLLCFLKGSTQTRAAFAGSFSPSPNPRPRCPIELVSTET